MEDRYFSTADMARLLNVSRSHVHNLLKNNSIVAYRFGKKYMVKESDFLNYVNSSKKINEDLNNQ